MKTKSTRFGFAYSDLPKVKTKYIHAPKSYLDPYYNVKERCIWDSVFIAGRPGQWRTQDRSKNVKFMYDTPLYKTGVVGYWVYDGLKFNYAQNFQRNGGILAAMSLWNDSYTHIYTDSDPALNAGIILGRTFLSLRSGALLLLDKRISKVSKLGLSEFEVSNPEEVSNWLIKLRAMSSDQRNVLREQELSTYPEWKSFEWSSILS
jgi:hypothetical protein